jgi:hypothetical protein
LVSRFRVVPSTGPFCATSTLCTRRSTVLIPEVSNAWFVCSIISAMSASMPPCPPMRVLAAEV